MTRTVLATSYGGPESLSVVEVEPAPPGAGEIAVSVRAIGVNQYDWKSYSGTVGDDPTKLPLRLGTEAAGVVTAVGEGAEGPVGPVHVGDEVMLYPIDGAYAEDLVVPAWTAVPKPASLTWPEAATLLFVGATAAHLVEAGAVASGDTVLVHGASGGVGSMVVQLAVARGARVIGTDGASRQDRVRELGAEPVVYGDGLVDRVRALAPEGVDVALDTAGADAAIEASLELVADRSRIATIANWTVAPAAGINPLNAGPEGSAIRNAARAELARLAGEGRLTVAQDRTFRLEEAGDAHALLSSGSAHGKVVLLL